MRTRMRSIETGIKIPMNTGTYRFSVVGRPGATGLFYYCFQQLVLSMRIIWK